MTEQEMKEVLKTALIDATSGYRMYHRDTSKLHSTRGEIHRKQLMIKVINMMRKNVNEAIKSCYEEQKYDLALYGEDFLSIFSQATFNWISVMDEDMFYSRIELILERASGYIERVVIDNG